MNEKKKKKKIIYIHLMEEYPDLYYKNMKRSDMNGQR